MPLNREIGYYFLQEIVELAGYTYRVSNMFDVFDDVSKGKYERSSIVSATKQHPACPLRFSENGQLVAMGEYGNNKNSR